MVYWASGSVARSISVAISNLAVGACSGHDVVADAVKLLVQRLRAHLAHLPPVTLLDCRIRLVRRVAVLLH